MVYSNIDTVEYLQHLIPTSCVSSQSLVKELTPIAEHRNMWLSSSPHCTWVRLTLPFPTPYLQIYTSTYKICKMISDIK